MPKLGSHLDFSQLEARNMTIQNSAAPSAPVKGQIYYDTASNTLLWWNGTAWISAVGGIYADATASSKGIVQLAGDLSGSAAAPVIATGAITSAKIADGTITDVDVAAANKDGAVGTYSMRTLGLGAAQAMPGNTRQDQIALPTAPMNNNSQRYTAIADPTAAQDAATKNYVDTLGSANLSWKQEVRVVAYGVNLTQSGTQTVDGVTLAVGDRVLCVAQTTANQNGIWIVQSGAWTRAPDMNTWTQTLGAIVPTSQQGTSWYGSIWRSNAFEGGTIGTTNLSFTAIPSAIGFGGTTPGYVMAGNATLATIGSSSQAQGDVYINNHKVTGLLDPTVSSDAATKNYVDNATQGLNAKAAVVCATTANITLSGLQAIDGYTTLANDRVLVKNQTTASQNGIYVAASGAWTRSLDNDTWAEMPGAYVWVEVGTANADSGWLCTNDPGGTLNTTNVTWVQFSGAGQITAGTGLTKSGNTLTVAVDGATIGFSGNNLTIPAGGVGAAQLASGAVVLSGADVTGTLPIVNGGTGQTTAKAARETGLSAAGFYTNSATHGAGATITIPQATHLLRAARDLHVQVLDATSGNVELPDIAVAANGDVTVTYAVSVAANSKYVTVVG